MKVIIQIPCYNESETLPETLAALPRTLPGVDLVEWLVIDDGSTDGTAALARARGVDHVLRLGHHGLAQTFMSGVRFCLENGADVIVNADGDHQYNAADIAKLVAPVLAGRADVVVGARPIAVTEDRRLKRVLQRLGSMVVRALSGADVEDATSGFRAISREAARRIRISSTYTYSVEMILRLSKQGLRFASVPVGVNPVRRPSRLVKNIPLYCYRQARVMLDVLVEHARERA